MDDQTLVCGGSLIVLIIVIVVYYLLNLRPFSFQKQKKGDNVVLTVTAKRNLTSVIILARFDGEEVTFERKRVRKGQSVEFSFPASEKKTRITVQPESGSVQAVEV